MVGTGDVERQADQLETVEKPVSQFLREAPRPRIDQRHRLAAMAFSVEVHLVQVPLIQVVSCVAVPRADAFPFRVEDKPDADGDMPVFPKASPFCRWERAHGRTGERAIGNRFCQPGKLSMYTDDLRDLYQRETRFGRTAVRFNLKRLLERAELPK